MTITLEKIKFKHMICKWKKKKKKKKPFMGNTLINKNIYF
jgi:hypothetical protein